jgi:hypothetical protein
MTTIGWNVYSDAEPDSFDVYRAITGVKFSFPNALQAGDILLFQATTRDLQKLVVAAADIDSVVALLNTAHGIKAVKSGTDVYVRCSARTNPKLKIQPCSFAANAGIPSGLYNERQNFVVIGNVPFITGTSVYSFADADGDPLDWYHIVSITGADRSLPSIDMQALLTPPGLCNVEGRVSDLQNRPVVGVLVDAHIQIPVGKVENTGLVTPNVQTITDCMGRWSLPLLRNQLVLFQIEAIGYNEVLVVPDAAFALFKDLKPVDDHLFTPGGDPIGGV